MQRQRDEQQMWQLQGLRRQHAKGGAPLASAASTGPGHASGRLLEGWRCSSAEVSRLIVQVMSRVAADDFGGRPGRCGFRRAPEAPRSSHTGPPGLPPPPKTDALLGPRQAVEAADGVKAPRAHAPIPSGTTTSPGTTCDVLEAVSSDDDADEEPGAQAGATTVMIRNIPRQYADEEMLQQEWPAELGYDFLYLPRSRDGKGNLRYAFVNFASESHAAAFRAKWHGNRLARFNEGKNLNISTAAVQGLEANVRYLREKSAEGGAKGARLCEPFILSGGRRVRLQDLP